MLLLIRHTSFVIRSFLTCFFARLFDVSDFVAQLGRPLVLFARDRLFILETYAAREAIADGMTAKQLSEEITSPEPTYCETFEGAAEAVAADLRRGDVFFTVGAGDVDSVGPMVLERLKARAQ